MYIYTAQIAKLKQLHIESYIDTTIKSGNKLFSPTWEMVNDVKSNKITPDEYTKLYYQMMRISYRQHQTEWDKLFTHHKNTPRILACYCKPYTFCHRHLLKDILMKCYDRSYCMGEIGISNEGILKQIRIDFQKHEDKLKEINDV